MKNLITSFLFFFITILSCSAQQTSVNDSLQDYDERIIPNLTKKVENRLAEFIEFHSDYKLKLISEVFPDDDDAFEKMKPWERTESYQILFSNFMGLDSTELDLELFKFAAEFTETFLNGYSDENSEFEISVSYLWSDFNKFMWDFDGSIFPKDTNRVLYVYAIGRIR